MWTSDTRPVSGLILSSLCSLVFLTIYTVFCNVTSNKFLVLLLLLDISIVVIAVYTSYTIFCLFSILPCCIKPMSAGIFLYLTVMHPSSPKKTVPGTLSAGWLNTKITEWINYEPFPSVNKYTGPQSAAQVLRHTHSHRISYDCIN